MRIIRDESAATYAIVPVEAEEEEKVSTALAILKPGDQLIHRGRKCDEESDKTIALIFQAGGEGKWESKKLSEWVTVTEMVYVGGVEVELRVDDDSWEELDQIAMTSYYSGGLIFLSVADVEGVKSVVVTGRYCKNCGAAIIDSGRCEWGVCEICVQKCEHEYRRGAIHGGKVDIGVGEYCGKCGRGKSGPEGEREKNLVEHHLAAERELGLSVFYPKLVPCTPKGQVEAARIFRRYVRSKQRSGD